MIFKIALRGIRKNLSMNLLTLLQMTAVLLAAGITVSSVYIRFKSYLPFRDYFEGKGILCEFGGPANEGLDENRCYKYLSTEKEILDRTSAQKVIGIHDVWLSPVGAEDINLAKILSYDDEFIERFTPELEEGSWLSTDTNTLELVVSQNDRGWSVGSIITFNCDVMGYRDLKVKGKVVGVLKNGAEIIYKQRGEEKNYYKNLYYPYYSEREQNEPLILMSASVYEKHLPPAPYINNMLLIYPETVSEEIIKRDMKALSKMNAVISRSLEEMDKNSKNYLYEQVYQMLPILIVMMILTAVSSVSSSALSARRNLRDYAKFYLLGLRWKQCGLIHLAEALIIGLASLILAGLGFAVINFTPLSEIWAVFGNKWLFLALGAPLVLHLTFSMIMPVLMLGRTQPKTLLQAE